MCQYSRRAFRSFVMYRESYQKLMGFFFHNCYKQDSGKLADALLKTILLLLKKLQYRSTLLLLSKKLQDFLGHSKELFGLHSLGLNIIMVFIGCPCK